jgi:hypothetical protein
VASAAIGAWLATNRKPGTDDAGIWHDTVPAALYTRQSPALVRKLWARTESALARRQSAAGSAEERAAYLAAMLVALGDDAPSRLVLELGADPNAPSKGFGQVGAHLCRADR